MKEKSFLNLCSKFIAIRTPNSTGSDHGLARIFFPNKEFEPFGHSDRLTMSLVQSTQEVDIMNMKSKSECHSSSELERMSSNPALPGYVIGNLVGNLGHKLSESEVYSGATQAIINNGEYVNEDFRHEAERKGLKFYVLKDNLLFEGPKGNLRPVDFSSEVISFCNSRNNSVLKRQSQCLSRKYEDFIEKMAISYSIILPRDTHHRLPMTIEVNSDIHDAALENNSEYKKAYLKFRRSRIVEPPTPKEVPSTTVQPLGLSDDLIEHIGNRDYYGDWGVNA